MLLCVISCAAYCVDEKLYMYVLLCDSMIPCEDYCLQINHMDTRYVLNHIVALNLHLSSFETEFHVFCDSQS